MENLVFCLNATIPIFFFFFLGLLFKNGGLFDDGFVKTMNSFVFKVALPVLLFRELSTADFLQVWDGRFVAFCFFATMASILLSVGIGCLLPDRSSRVCSGGLPVKRRSFGNRVYYQYFWKRRDGSIDDYRNGSSL